MSEHRDLREQTLAAAPWPCRPLSLEATLSASAPSVADRRPPSLYQRPVVSDVKAECEGTSTASCSPRTGHSSPRRVGQSSVGWGPVS